MLLVDGSLAVYKALWDFVPSEEHRSANLSLAIRFVKCASHNLDFHRPAAYPRQIIPAQTPTGHHGLFVTGEQSFWILASDHGPTHVLDVHQGEIKAFLSPVARHKILYAGSDVSSPPLFVP